ncbi:MAG TPA: YARHG domain-containing protein, partial [Blastocatellia bacterium]|nr:YARHG domain-containing protein [Blastocatellia bacterium]
KQSRTGLIAGVSIAAVVLLIGAVAGFLLLNNGGAASQGGLSNQNSNSGVPQSQAPAYAAANTNQAATPTAPVTVPNRNTSPALPPVAQPAEPDPPPASASTETPKEPDAPTITPARSEEAIALRAENKILANQRLTESDLEGLSAGRLRMLRNTVYARHGRPFRAPVVRVYFQSREWYRPRPGYSDADLTPVDRANIRTILAAERSAR